VRIACVDIGGSTIAAAILDGEAVGPLRSRRTGAPLTPDQLVERVATLLERLGRARQVGVGFPGIVEGGVVRTADNLGEAALWVGFDLAAALGRRLEAEVRVANDADVAALGCSTGEGVELTVTLGTGVGTGIVVDGVLQDHRELSAIPIGQASSLDAFVGEAARRELAEEVWNARCGEVLHLLDRLVAPDQIWLAGGNARRVRRSTLGELESRLWVVSEPVGVLGAAKLFAEG
jgi:polyphosphate glucokinase